MSDNLKVKAARGLFWSSVDRFSSQGISFVFSIFLARILDISDYGIVAMIVVFMAVAQAFVDSGFSSALIRKPDLNEEDKSIVEFLTMVGSHMFGIRNLFVMRNVNNDILEGLNSQIQPAEKKMRGSVNTENIKYMVNFVMGGIKMDYPHDSLESHTISYHYK
jgi:polysaccharide biosynthesis protein